MLASNESTSNVRVDAPCVNVRRLEQTAASET